MIDFISESGTLLWLTAISLLTFAGTLLVVPWLVIRLPADYFSHRTRREAGQPEGRPVARVIVIIMKNLMGIIIVTAGLIMLFIPGQGLLTIVIGLVLLDFPGKYIAERWIVTRGPVLKSINHIRKRARRQPLEL